ncbi:MAG: hypothetical protein FJ398_07170 [Verrucomicrobia bacterium]|nr:hypothetical protein [Verrucomicrobiota bacterium]
MGCVQGSGIKEASHGRASLSPASRVGRIPRLSSGSLRTTRPTADRFSPQRAESDVFHARRAAR